MSQINWKVRLKNPQTVMALVSLVLLLSEQVLRLFGIELKAAISEQVTSITETVLYILVVLGVITDPTTSGLKDSRQALGYKKPKKEVNQ